MRRYIAVWLMFQANAIPLTSMVLSAVFWPAFREEKLKVPEEVQRFLKKKFSFQFVLALIVICYFVP